MRWSSPVDRHDAGSLAQVFLREPDDDRIIWNRSRVRRTAPSYFWRLA